MDEKKRQKLLMKADEIRKYSDPWHQRSYDLVTVAHDLGITPEDVLAGRHRDLTLPPVKPEKDIFHGFRTSDMPKPQLERLIISAPFGNYEKFRLPHSTPTLGTFTLHRRAGWLKRIWRILLTLRYRRGVGWINKLGLPNPGIDWLLEQTDAVPLTQYGGFCYRLDLRDKIVSIGVTNSGPTGAEELEELLQVCDHIHPAPFAWEYNAGCPNVGAHLDCKRAFSVLANWKGLEASKLIIKLPPIDYEPLMYEFADIADYFHCCNTLPVAGGGLSGPVLRPLVRRAIRDAKKIASDVKIIAGGGVVDSTTAEAYLGHGADHVAIASMLLNPLNRRKALKIAEKLA